MKLVQQFLLNFIILHLIFCIVSCRKIDSEEMGNTKSTGSVTLHVQSVNISYNEKEQKVSSHTLPLEPQIETIQLDEETFATATLTNEGYVEEKYSSNNKIANTAPILDGGIKYRLLVFEGNTFIDSAVFSSKQGNQGKPIMLKHNRTYTFIAYSLHNNNTPPPAVIGSTLANSYVQGLSGKILYFQENIKMNSINNHVNIIFKPLYSEIRTTFSVNNPNTTYIRSLLTPTLQLTNNYYASARLNFGNKTVTYTDAPADSLNKKIYFSSSTNDDILFSNTPNSVTSETQYLNISSSTTAKLTLPGITIYQNGIGHTKSAQSFNNLQIAQGQKYNLKITISKSCTVSESNTVKSHSFPSTNVTDGSTKTLTIDKFVTPNSAVIFDIKSLDNSFNININTGTSNKNIATKEIQFENINNQATKNIMFEDGSMYGQNGIPDIWNIIGTELNPAIRVIVTNAGVVSLFGSKYSGGPLYPLKLYNGNSLQTILWKTSGNKQNTLKINQTVRGDTNLDLKIYRIETSSSCN